MRRLPVFLFCTVLLLLLKSAVFCQDNYFIQHYTNENGLPANGVKGIELDKKSGFLWVGTQAGLVRFDGKNFKHFGSAKNTAVPSRIHFIAKNREGNIYCEEDNFLVYGIASGSDKLLPKSYMALNEVAKILNEDQNLQLMVEGHTDATGSQEKNFILSEQRAQSVANYLTTKGIAGSRIQKEGYGSSKPVASNATAAGRNKNRRVELKLSY